MDSVVLGLQQLERQQQAEREQKRQAAQVFRVPHEEDDDTVPSSTQNSNTNEDPLNVQGGSSIGRFITNTRKRLSSRDLKASANEKTMMEPVTHAVYGNVPEVSEMLEFEAGNLLICGYLHKFGRNGKWQRRFFETDGENLTYYKTSARSKLLATLDLLKVGDICVESQDPDGCTFIIQVADRPYRLRADSQSSCRDWVITLNRVKEARMHLGRMALVKPAYSGDQDDIPARVVLEANRKRTKAVDDENITSWEDIVAAGNAASQQEGIEQELSASHATRLGTASKRIQEAAAARWQKRQSSVQLLASRIIVWAKHVRVMQKLKCTDVEDQVVVLDGQIHPPGHNDSYGQPSQGTNRSSESSVASQKVGPSVTHTPRGSRDEAEEETRELS
jgi:hypothetical protein